ncbi:MAG: hypothetical protein KTR30_23745 [Saprospiraceae bacterium]|nr:hypothetical protein [Saprospiraceae bacterium]
MKSITTHSIQLEKDLNKNTATSSKTDSQQQLVAVLCLLFFPFMYLIGTLITHLF